MQEPLADSGGMRPFRKLRDGVAVDFSHSVRGVRT